MRPAFLKVAGILFLLSPAVYATGPVTMMQWDQKPVQWRISSDGKHGVVVSWIEQGSTTRWVGVQRMTFDNDLPWGYHGVHVGSASVDIEDLQVVSNGRGGAIMGWRATDGIHAQFWMQELSALGEPRWLPAGKLVANGLGPGSGMALEADQGKIRLAWEEFAEDAPRIRVQEYDAKGRPRWPDGNTLASSSGPYLPPAIVPDRNGGFFVIWYSVDEAGVPTLLGQSINAKGHLAWDPRGVVISTHRENSRIETGAVTERGELVLVWHDQGRQDAWMRWTAQRVDSSGQRRWGADGIELVSEEHDQENAVAAIASAGRFALAWNERRNALDKVFAQEWDHPGQPAWSIPSLAVDPSQHHPDTEQVQPAIVMDLHSVFVLWWETTDPARLRVQRFNEQGARSSETGVTVVKSNFRASPAQVVSDGSGGLFAVWMESPDPRHWQLRAQRLEHGEFSD